MMKTYTAPIPQNRNLQSVAGRNLVPFMAASMRDIVTLVGAMLMAASIITLSVWMAGMGAGAVLAAGTWGLGFVFLGLAMDEHGPVALYRAATGIALLILALLQTRVSADFVIVSAVLLAAWAGFALFKRLSLQD
jgi:hypothetical protein